jgi:hypothetical protein
MGRKRGIATSGYSSSVTGKQHYCLFKNKKKVGLNFLYMNIYNGEG